MANRSAPQPAPRTILKVINVHPQEGHQVGLDCVCEDVTHTPPPLTHNSTSPETPVCETEILQQKPRKAALLPPQTSTKPGVARNGISRCSEKSPGLDPAVKEELNRRLSIGIQVMKEGRPVGLDCVCEDVTHTPPPLTHNSTSPETPVCETEILQQKPRKAALPPPQTSTKPGVARDGISRCSEKSAGLDPAVKEELNRRLSIGIQDKKSLRKANTLRESSEGAVVSDSDFRAFMSSGKRFQEALQRFVSHLTAREVILKTHSSELQDVADAVDKTHKGVKIAGITGGATGAVGGAAAVAGILLAPVTMGASLAITALGVGVAAAGGVTGASAAITNTVHKSQFRKKVESVLKEHQTKMKDMESVLKEISTEVEELRRYDLQTLNRVNVRSAGVVKLLEIAGGTMPALGTLHKSTGVIEGFALGLDLFFTPEDSQKLKKESKSRFAKQIREVAGHIEANVKELMDMREALRSEGI